MKRKENIFRFFCQKDIEEIFDIVDKYIPECDIDNLNQSIIYEEDKKIICRSIKNKYNEKVGKELIIQIYDTGDIYRIKDNENYIKYEKNNHNTKEKVKITLENYTIKRCFLYKNKDVELTKEETYNLELKKDLHDYIYSDSIEQSMYNLKNKNKIRKRI